MYTVDIALIVRNEETGLRAILPQLPLHLFQNVFAIDGNSKDGTLEILTKAGIRVIRQRNPGLGAAMIEAREHVASHSFVFFHPDGNEDPADLSRMVRLLSEGRDFVVASRMIRGARNEEDRKNLRWRKWANRGFALLANLLFAREGNRTSDVTNGFRGISCAAFDRMNLSSKDLTLDYQMVIHALKLRIPITEFPTREGERIGGETNFPSISTGLSELKLVAREILLGLTNV